MAKGKSALEKAVEKGLIDLLNEKREAKISVDQRIKVLEIASKHVTKGKGSEDPAWGSGFKDEGEAKTDE